LGEKRGIFQKVIKKRYPRWKDKRHPFKSHWGKSLGKRESLKTKRRFWINQTGFMDR